MKTARDRIGCSHVARHSRLGNAFERFGLGAFRFAPIEGCGDHGRIRDRGAHPLLAGRAWRQ
jgi:hypothetical protein